MNVRPARPGDERAIAQVHVRTWQVAYRGQVPDAFLDALSIEARADAWQAIIAESVWPQRAAVVIEDGARVVGFAHVSPSRDADAGTGVGEVTAIYLLPEYWGGGWGRALLDRAVDTLRAAGCNEATLWVLETNARARRFYEAAGWALDGATKVDDRRSFSLREVRYRRTLVDEDR